MQRPVIYPYNMGSNSAKLLAQALECKRVYPNRRYRPRPNDLVINWGNSNLPQWDNSIAALTMLNCPLSVYMACNKLFSFVLLNGHGISMPRFTQDVEEAKQWGTAVVCRRLLNSSGGRGISIVQPSDTFPDVPLYVEYVKKKREYRVHVFNGEVIDIQMKRVRTDREEGETNYQIRSHSNGWVFVRDSIREWDDSFGALATQAVEAMGLAFGAVDIIYNRHEGRAYVLEVNTAPGLEGETVNKYANAIRSLLV